MQNIVYPTTLSLACKDQPGYKDSSRRVEFDSREEVKEYYKSRENAVCLKHYGESGKADITK